MSVTFTDNSIAVKAKITSTASSVIEECAGELESAVKRNTKRKTGQTANSWQHVVKSSADEVVGVVGSNYENAIWEEYGTGEWAEKGGRKGGWKYKDASGQWHFTKGKKPRRPFRNAWDSMKNPLVQRIQNAFKGL